MKLIVPLLMLLFVVVVGCEPQVPESGSVLESPEVTIQGSPDEGHTVESTVVETIEVQPVSMTEKKGAVPLKLVDWAAVEKLVASETQQGKIVVLDLWSSWCLPCVREYPHLVALQKKYPQQVSCISLNLNYDGSKNNPPESHVKDVQAFLDKKDSQLHNLLSTQPDEKIYEILDIAAIPVVYVYQQDGTLKKRFDNETLAYGDEGFTYEAHIVPLVEELVKTQGK